MDAFLISNAVKGMKSVNREMFKKVVSVPAIILQPKKCALFRDYFKDKHLYHPKIRGIQNAADNQHKLLLLQPAVQLSDTEQKWIADNEGKLSSKDLHFDYGCYTIREVLRAILPTEIEVPTSFEEIGHIVHLNLRDEQLPYKEVIGEVILDKQPGIETVVNKVANIDETFRFFKMDILAGKDDLMTTVKENNCTFTFDFSKVYWNSRLHMEHMRIIDMLERDDIVLDVFAGVGPFAIPACRKGCVVYANDLNPIAYSSLTSNAEANKVGRNLKMYCLDGREFIKKIVPELIAKYKGQGPIVSHILMNLPALAAEFLDAFKGLFNSLSPNLRTTVPMPKIHCYCFSKATDYLLDSKLQVQKHLGTDLDDTSSSCTITTVRTVAPNKYMTRVSFTLPTCVAYWDEPVPSGDTTDSSHGDMECENQQLKGTKRSIDACIVNINPLEDGEEERSGAQLQGAGSNPPLAKKEKL